MVSFDPPQTREVGIFIPILMPIAFLKMEGEHAINQGLGLLLMLLHHY